MPDRDVRTIRHLIYYQYAKIMARRAFQQSNGKAAKAKHYGFTEQTLRDLVAGVISWSDITREDWQLVESDKECSFCGASQPLSREHLVPRSLRINERCCTCDAIQSIHNQVWSCRTCNSRKSQSGVYAFYARRFPGESKFYGLIPPLVEKKYLKTIYRCHQCAGTLDCGDIDGDGNLTVMDLDFIVHEYCNQ
ncbi:MAG: HNH endonuclease [Ignavibacteriales bacterium]